MHLKEGKALPVSEVGKVISSLGLRKEIEHVKRWYVLFLYYIIKRTVEESGSSARKVLLYYGIPEITYKTWKQRYGGDKDEGEED